MSNLRAEQHILRVTFIFIMAFALIAIGCSALSESNAQASNRADVLKMNNPPIRVRLIKTINEMTIVPQASWNAGSLDGSSLVVLKKDEAVSIKVKDGKIALKAPAGKCTVSAMRLNSDASDAVLEIKKVPYGVGWWWEDTQDRTYQGDFEIRVNDEGMLEVIVVLLLEDYLTGVVPSEIGPTSPDEALRAQAIAARSEALMALSTGKYAGPHHDIGSDVDSQAFSGNVKRSEASDAAVKATSGMALFFDGKPLPAYYASSCGGHSEDIRNVWPARAQTKGYWDCGVFDGEGKFNFDLTKDADLRKWLDADPNVYCNPNKSDVPDWAAKNFRWTKEFTAEELTKLVAKKKDIGRVTKIKALLRGVSGRMIEAEFIGEMGSIKIGPELAIRQVFDPPLKSAAFVVDVEGSADKPDKFIIRGAGWGHGVGMCQTGAISQAHSGRNFRQILQHYYPTSKIKKIY
jgi:stage II sporulation protein D